MSYFRALLGLSLLLFVAACGDIKVRTMADSERNQLANVTVIDASGRVGQLYTRQLRDNLGGNGSNAPTHVLTSNVTSNSVATLSVIGSSSDLKKMTMTVSFELMNSKTGKVELNDTISTDATLGAVTSYFGQDESETQGKERLAKLLADRVARRIQLFLITNGD
jgi:hypothetical protein